MGNKQAHIKIIESSKEDAQQHQQMRGNLRIWREWKQTHACTHARGKRTHQISSLTWICLINITPTYISRFIAAENTRVPILIAFDYGFQYMNEWCCTHPHHTHLVLSRIEEQRRRRRWRRRRKCRCTATAAAAAATNFNINKKVLFDVPNVQWICELARAKYHTHHAWEMKITACVLVCAATNHVEYAACVRAVYKCTNWWWMWLAHVF